MRSLLTLLAVLALAAPAHAATKVPRAFYGVAYGGEIRDASASIQTRAWGRMAKNRVGAARTVFSWSKTQPDADGAFDFTESDRYVADAARRRIQLLPVLTSTPLWARERVSHWWPRDPAALARYVDALVRRYGRNGSYWDEHPEVPRRPVRHWQIYNEPGRSKRYAPLLRAAYRAVKDADPGAKVVLAGLTGTDHGTPWGILRYQYRKGKIRRWFDVAAIHMYTGKPANVLEGVRRFRAVMRRHRDGKKPLWLTEFGITASRGRTEAPRSQRTLRTTDRGMARYLTKAYALLVRNHRRKDVRLARAYWYTWSSSYERGAGIFSFAGLNRFADGRLRARPALRAYRRSAARHQR